VGARESVHDGVAAVNTETLLAGVTLVMLGIGVGLILKLLDRIEVLSNKLDAKLDVASEGRRVIAADLEDTHKRAEHVDPDAVAGEASDAAMRRDENGK
jgi:hypothetical protein